MPRVPASRLEPIFKRAARDAEIPDAENHCRRYKDGWWSIGWDYYKANETKCRHYWKLVNDDAVRRGMKVELGGFPVSRQRGSTEWQAAFRYWTAETPNEKLPSGPSVRWWE